jgi:hypothetical protein
MTATSPSAVFVESQAAHPDFDDRDVHRRVGEGDEGEHREQLEEGESASPGCRELGVDEVDERLDLVPGIRDQCILDRLAVDHDALGEALEVRAREQPVRSRGRARSTRSCARSRSCRSCRSRARRGTSLRVVEEFQHAARALDARLHPLLALPGQQAA